MREEVKNRGVSRRGFLKSTAALSTGLVVAFCMPNAVCA